MKTIILISLLLLAFGSQASQEPVMAFMQPLDSDPSKMKLCLRPMENVGGPNAGKVTTTCVIVPTPDFKDSIECEAVEPPVYLSCPGVK